MRGYAEVDIRQFITVLRKKAWLVILAAVLTGSAAFLGTRLLMVPLYTTGIKMYVNNSTEINTDISSSDLTASQSLVGTYITIIKSDVVLDAVAQLTKLPYGAGEIKAMLSAGAINNTEVFMVSVTNPDPETATKIANSIAEIASDKIAEIVSGSSVKIVDYAKVPTTTSSPNYLVNISVGVLSGIVLSVGILLLKVFLDTRIRTENDLEAVTNLPVLGMISEFRPAGKGDAGYGYGYCYGETPGEGEKERKS